MQQRGGLNVEQRAVANLALIHLTVLLQTLGNQRIERGELVGELAGVKLLPPGLKGAENSGTQQAADILAHAEQHREAHQVALVGNDAANPRQHRRGEEKGAAEAQQKLAEHQLLRSREDRRLAVEQRGNHNQRQRRGGGPVEALRVERQAAGDDAADDPGKN